jgi:phenylalanyl-tRNA synthetase beta chain
MKVPLSWLKDFVDVDIPIAELTHRLTLAGLEVEQVHFAGLPLPKGAVQGHTSGRRGIEANVTGLGWDPQTIVVGAIHEVMPHPNADRLILCRLHDGEREHVVLTGAPNLFHLTGKGPLDEPIKVAYAREGAVIFDGHKQGWERMTLKRAKIRGVESYSMACSEKELGISEEHEGIIILDDEAPVGTPLVEYMGDAVLDITLTPNVARDANILGVARETAALTGVPLREPSYDVPWGGPPIEGRASIEIRHTELNPRFVLGLIEGVQVGPSPYWAQRRLRLAGMRPINNIVDATNYVMLEIGEPLHAFDYDVLVERAGGSPPTIITRLPEPGERLMTLDDVDRELDEFTVLVADTVGALSIAGVMGGEESEVSETTTNVLLEGAAWNYINIRRTVASQKLISDASYRFERGVHPAMAERGVRRGLRFMAQLAGGSIAEGLIDAYPQPPEAPTVTITPEDSERWLGVRIDVDTMEAILRRLEFKVEVEQDRVIATAPDHRLDISPGVVGVSDLMEEISRIYGYDRIPETQISDTIPPQYGSPRFEKEERMRDLLVRLGLQEVVTYRLTSPEREARLRPPGSDPDRRPYVRLTNPIVSDRVVMRHSLLASVMEVVEHNARVRERIAVFEIGSIFLPQPEQELPEESSRLAIALTGARRPADWQEQTAETFNFYDMKGFLQALFDGLHLPEAKYVPREHPTFHPGKCAGVLLGGEQIGLLGEIHPLVLERYDLPQKSVIAADLDAEALLEHMPESHSVQHVFVYPPVLEDLAVVVEEDVTGEQVEQVIRKAGGSLLSRVQLFDLYRGEQVGAGKKSLAYSLIYQAPDRTLTDKEVAKVRKRVVDVLNKELGATLRD